MSIASHHSISPDNLAIRHRDKGNYRRAYYWWCRAAESGDGDSWVDVAYCLEHGIGVRRDVEAALRAYRRAIRHRWITAWVQEEAHYRRGLLLLVRGARAREKALEHLTIAAADGDYPEALALLSAARAGSPSQWCNCRRGRGRHVLGQAPCRLHTARNRHGRAG